MKLKIKIKEVKEERRPLTIEERCMHSVATNPDYIDSYRGEVSRRLDKIGFVKRVHDGDIDGVFRTETIRDATPAEIMAYHCIKIHDECGLKVNECDTCVMNIWAYSTCGMGKLFLKSTKILKDKEIILELV